MTNNMTSGSPLKHLLRFAFPVWLGILFQQMYNIADTMIVGRYLGLNQLAGVGATAFFMNLVIWFFGGMCNGFCIPVAQNFGGGRDHMVRRYLSAGIRLALMITLVGVTVMAILAGPFGFTGVCCANALAWIFTALFAIPAYLVCRKQLQKKFNAEMNT